MAPEWQTFGQRPADENVEQVIKELAAYLRTREDVDTDLLGLAGCCARNRQKYMNAFTIISGK